MKRILSLVLTLAMLSGCLLLPAAAADAQDYQQGQFSDVSAASWYAGSVAAVCSAGLMQGDGDEFLPDAQLTVAEALVLACRVHSLLTGNSTEFTESSPWYQVYVDYALEHALLDWAYTDYTVSITRAEFAQIISAAVPDAHAVEINSIDDGAISDVPVSASYAQSVYRLYRAGILTGSSLTGRFRPAAAITRAEAAAVLARIIDPDSRISLTLTAAAAGSELTASEIYAQCAPGVFYLEVYDAEGSVISSGSGIFLDSDGLAATNYHVIDGGVSASITTYDGAVSEVLGVYAYDPDYDLAILQIDGSGFTALPLSTAELSGGDTVYTIGAPLGLASTISDGIISSPSRTISGITYIQTTASISSGSSGGALINAWGEVIGITTASLVLTSGISQNLNLALPVALLDELEWGTLRTLEELAAEAAESETADTESEAAEISLYSNGAPDYGSVTGAECISSWFEADDRTEDGQAEGADRYLYPHDVQAAADYMRWLLDHDYTLTGSEEIDAGVLLIYTLEQEGISVGVCVDRDGGGIYIYVYAPAETADSETAA